ncbi:hypothetical protein ID866_7595 [Astraeus odoratus]|nr:hypothetical protein ID866_7595 [Astraeus odoratus]
MCMLCGEDDSPQHILIECKESTYIKIIWGLAKDLWCKREESWPEIFIGSLLGANLSHFLNKLQHKYKGRDRLFSILALESVYLLWKLHWNWVIEHNGDRSKLPSNNEIHNRWVKAINMHLKFDRLQTDKVGYESQAISIELVLKTWSGILLNEENLLDNWIRESGVLVCITPHRPPGQGG